MGVEWRTPWGRCCQQVACCAKMSLTDVACNLMLINVSLVAARPLLGGHTTGQAFFTDTLMFISMMLLTLCCIAQRLCSVSHTAPTPFLLQTHRALLCDSWVCFSCVWPRLCCAGLLVNTLGPLLPGSGALCKDVTDGCSLQFMLDCCLPYACMTIAW